jgi:hypothetical protein
MKIKIVSTFSDKAYTEYGKYFVESCKKFISPDINVSLYVDNVTISESENTKILKLEPSIPELTEFKKRNAHKKFKDFRWDGVRFSHKTYAIFHAAQEKNLDYLIWLDSDTEIYEKITKEYLLQFLPSNYFVGYIGRNKATETGFLIFNMRHPATTEFFQRFKYYYDSNALYNVPEYHDAYIFDVVRKEFEESGKIKSYNVSPHNVTKNHFNATFEGYMIQYKGDDKGQRDIKITKALNRKKRK